MEPTARTRIMALDVGKRRIGVAVSDELGITAQGLQTLQRCGNREDFAILTRMAAARNVNLFLIGNPIHMSGGDTRQAEWVREFADGLTERSGVPATLWDERLTSVEAGRVLRQSGISIEKRARAVDRLSAVLLLQSYLDAVNICAPPPEEFEG